MGWFNKRKVSRNSGREIARDRIAKGLAGILNKMQNGWAAWMTRQTNRLSPRGKGIAFFLYGVMMACACTYIIISSLSGKTGGLSTGPDDRNQKVILQQSEAVDRKMPAGIRGRIASFRSLLDSLGQTEQGRRQRDSLLQSRPGLMDSITRVEQLYRYQ
ncbi:hypothetical protein [Pedobacter nutrimenti]|uniref:hypothetical protein n=1 Tax=Pedobacter nutrimenti TaxID=1241337 RepID=UPI0029302844|nr:hypothetical protein [Pedobacter nutrimenti]